ncbi:Hypothetical protein PHPALM_7471 [Phytophthora palmivora]|uniref:Uncharacterized protein n=1 Tax=Phytophthora palmivora TaxID=4796 RepID=A0A2P4YCA6_9STRA|nr:Hypothetical protein PHPALM_7471 [Phytophthora palmivora]
MKMLHQELSFLVRMHDRNYVPTVYSFMKSEKGGREQDPHQDYTPAAIAKVANKYPGTIPCSMIVALGEGTKLQVFDGRIVTLPERLWSSFNLVGVFFFVET